MTRHFYEQHRADYLFSAAVSAILIPQSYLSLEFILQQHNLLTEITYPITCFDSYYFQKKEFIRLPRATELQQFFHPSA
jgi:hypothetical protein